VIRCKDCDFWLGKYFFESDYYTGEEKTGPVPNCSHPKWVEASKEEVPPSDGVHYWDFEDYGAMFATGPEFGCIHGEAPDTLDQIYIDEEFCKKVTIKSGGEDDEELVDWFEDESIAFNCGGYYEAPVPLSKDLGKEDVCIVFYPKEGKIIDESEMLSRLHNGPNDWVAFRSDGKDLRPVHVDRDASNEVEYSKTL